MYRRMEEMATTDGLTELPNHRTFQARFSEMLHRAERHAKPVSFVLSDVDRFKSINDTYGHLSVTRCSRSSPALWRARCASGYRCPLRR